MTAAITIFVFGMLFLGALLKIDNPVTLFIGIPFLLFGWYILLAGAVNAIKWMFS
jgi:hypothetical protein